LTRAVGPGEYNILCACIAQLVEQLTLNQWVPVSLATIKGPLGGLCRHKHGTTWALVLPQTWDRALVSN